MPFGISVEDGLAAAVGGYLARNLAGLAKRTLPGLTEVPDRFRPGLSTGLWEFAGAGVVHWLGGMVGREYRRAAVIGASAVASSDTLAAFFSQVDLLAGHPALALPGFGAPASTSPAATLSGQTPRMGALPAPGASGVQGVPVPSSISLLGYGSYGY